MATCVETIQGTRSCEDIKKLEFYQISCSSDQIEELIDQLGYASLAQNNLGEVKASIQEFAEKNSAAVSDKSTQQKVETIFDAIRTAFFSVLAETTDFQNLFEKLKEMLAPFPFSPEDHHEAVKNIVLKRIKRFHTAIPDWAISEYLGKEPFKLNLGASPDTYEDRNLDISPFTEFFESYVKP